MTQVAPFGHPCNVSTTNPQAGDKGRSVTDEPKRIAADFPGLRGD